MNILKEAIQKLRIHLGRDAIGINLLDAVTTIANEQRKRVAALEEASAADRESVKTLRTKLDELQSQVARLNAELEKQSALREAAQQRERAALAQVSKPEELEVMEDLALERRIHVLLRNVQKRFKKLPAARLGGQGRHLYLEDFVKNYAYDEFAGLGMAVGAVAVMGMPVPSLIAERTYSKIRRPRDYDVEKDLHLGRFVHWYRDCFGGDPSYVKEISERIYIHSELPKD